MRCCASQWIAGGDGCSVLDVSPAKNRTAGAGGLDKFWLPGMGSFRTGGSNSTLPRAVAGNRWVSKPLAAVASFSGRQIPPHLMTMELMLAQEVADRRADLLKAVSIRRFEKAAPESMNECVLEVGEHTSGSQVVHQDI